MVADVAASGFEQKKNQEENEDICTGVFELEDHVYRAIPLPSSSLIKQYLKSARTAYHYQHNPNEPSMSCDVRNPLEFGIMAHCAVLEPQEFLKRYKYIPHAMNRNPGREMATEARNQGLIPVSESTSKIVRGMIDAIHEHELANKLMETSNKPELREVSVIWDVPGLGMYKSRLDAVSSELGRVVDLKTVASVNERDYVRAVHKFGYHISAAMYLDAINQQMEGDFHSMVHILVEKTPPFEVAVYELDETWITRGRELYLELMQKHKDCEERQVWPFREERAVTIYPEPWMI